MIEVRIPKEIKAYKEKLFYNLTLRQTVCSVLAISINVPLYYFGKEYISQDILSWIVLFVAVPIFLVGYFNYNGLNFEDFIKAVFKYNFLYPQKRKYKSENLFEILLKKEGEKK